VLFFLCLRMYLCMYVCMHELRIFLHVLLYVACMHVRTRKHMYVCKQMYVCAEARVHDKNVICPALRGSRLLRYEYDSKIHGTHLLSCTFPKFCVTSMCVARDIQNVS
jgi:hypothetical protein